MAMTFEHVLVEVTGLFRDVLDNDSINLKYETSAPDVQDWDSLNHIEIVVAVEKHFKIKFNFAELQKFQNVGQMCDNILVKLAQAGR
jgi:acyl carrier protein